MRSSATSVAAFDPFVMSTAICADRGREACRICPFTPSASRRWLRNLLSEYALSISEIWHVTCQQSDQRGDIESLWDGGGHRTLGLTARLRQASRLIQPTTGHVQHAPPSSHTRRPISHQRN